eukprot:TRINITY_DN1244_c0_g1_i1.p1 TRINITY_DN1244_c0_g1~~TRINITY_DN1244_c0_g1_i1.p1  ORF type:complete len:181 (-),score=23.49 TRINITY_DN1244_c0_g1_i1:303-845(-)
MGRDIVIVMTGSGGVGKSAITIQYMQGVFVKKYDPTIEEYYRKTVEVDDRSFRLEIIDTAGTEQFTTMHDLYMKNGQGFVLVFSLIADATFHDIMTIRNQVIKVKDTEDVPMVLAANKADRTDRAVTKEELQELGNKYFGGHYYETSASEGTNIKELFEDVIRQVVGKIPVKTKSRCQIL